MMKKVVFIKEALPGGTENYCTGLYDLFSGDPDVTILPVKRIPQIESRLLHYRYDKEVLREHIQDADIVHINGYTAQGTIDALKLSHALGKKIVYTAHFHPFQYLGKPFFAKLFFNVLLKPLINRYADVVTTINDEDTAFFKSFHHNVVRIPHWNRYVTAGIEANHKKRNPRMILFVGRINDHVKNFQQLFALEEGKYEIHCVGKGHLTEMRNDIILHEEVSYSELSDLYRQASLLVAPSKYEAFSFVVLEALSHGTPVVMSERVRIADHLDGIRGYSIFQYDDSSDFINKVENTIGTEVDIEEVFIRFNPIAIAKKYKELYMSL